MVTLVTWEKRTAREIAPLRVIVEEKETPKSGMRDVQWLSILLQPQCNSADLDIDGLTRRNKCEGSSVLPWRLG